SPNQPTHQQHPVPVTHAPSPGAPCRRSHRTTAPPPRPRPATRNNSNESSSRRSAPSRSEALLRDIALRRGSLRRPRRGGARAYGGDAEFSPAHQHQHHAPATANAALAADALPARGPLAASARERADVVGVGGGGSEEGGRCLPLPLRRGSVQSAQSGGEGGVGARSRRGGVGNGNGSGSKRDGDAQADAGGGGTEDADAAEAEGHQRRQCTASPGLRSPVSPHPHAQHAPSPYYRTTPTPRPRTPLNQEGTPRRARSKGGVAARLFSGIPFVRSALIPARVGALARYGICLSGDFTFSFCLGASVLLRFSFPVLPRRRLACSR
ncbi:hypothetical protein B0H14DRAFT_2765679, partial [Mycena olivaceomarginata]